MQIDDLLILEKLSKINNPCLQKVIEWKRCLDSMGFVRVPISELRVNIQITYDLLILQVLYKFNCVFPIIIKMSFITI